MKKLFISTFIVVSVISITLYAWAQGAAGDGAALPGSDTLTDAIETIGSGAAQYGWLGVLSALFTTGVGVFKWLFPTYWGQQKRWVKLCWVFGTSAVGVGIISFLGGVALPATIAAGLLGGLTAIGGHQVKKSAEEILQEKRNNKAKKEMEAIGKQKGLDLKPNILTDEQLKQLDESRRNNE